MEVYKRTGSPNWYVDLTHPRTGERLRTSLKFGGSKTEAQKRAAKMLAGLGEATPETVTIEAALRAYIRSLKARGKGTHVDHEYRLPKLLKLVDGNLPLHELTPRMIEHITLTRMEEGRAPQTIKHDLSLLRAAALYAGSLGAALPARIREKDFWHMPRPGQKTRYLSPVEFRRLVGYLDPDRPINGKPLPHAHAAARREVRDIAIGLAYTGARWGELAGLTWEQIDLVGGSIRLWGNKVQRERVVPIADPLRDVLRRRLGERGRSPWVFPGPTGQRRRQPSEALREAMQAVGLNDPETVARYGTASAHSLRHTFASWLRQNGADLDEVANALGHANLAMTKRYAHLGRTATITKLGAILNSVETT